MRVLLPAVTAVVALLVLSLDSGQGQISGLNIGTAAALGVAGNSLKNLVLAGSRTV